MLIKQYQEKTGPFNLNKDNLEHLYLGIAGEAGEVCELRKKSIRDNKPIDRKRLGEELGDLLWYIAEICNKENLDMSQIMIDNIDKLNRRHKNDK